MLPADPNARFYLREDVGWLATADESLTAPGKSARDAVFNSIKSLEAEVYRQTANRRTVKFCSTVRAASSAEIIPPKTYFAKIHLAVGWREVLKNWVSLKRPVMGARNEYRACLHLAEQSISAPRVAAFGERGWNSVYRESFVMCDAVEPSVSLESFCSGWHDDPPEYKTKLKLLHAVADIARAVHACGVVHRDFYICHLLLHTDLWRLQRVHLSVIDLHRALLFKKIPRRWLVRDLAALLYSTLDMGLSQRDWLRFIRRYRGGRKLREIIAEEDTLWGLVYRRALKLYQKGMRRGLMQGYFLSSPHPVLSRHVFPRQNSRRGVK